MDVIRHDDIPSYKPICCGFPCVNDTVMRGFAGKYRIAFLGHNRDIQNNRSVVMIRHHGIARRMMTYGRDALLRVRRCGVAFGRAGARPWGVVFGRAGARPSRRVRCRGVVFGRAGARPSRCVRSCVRRRALVLCSVAHECIIQNDADHVLQINETSAPLQRAIKYGTITRHE